MQEDNEQVRAGPTPSVEVGRTEGNAEPRAQSPLFVVGIGASTGGLAALESFFAQVPANSGLTYVVVVHLQSEFESHLADLLQPHVQLPVLQARDAQPLLPDHVYVIPPAHNLSVIDHHLRLAVLEEQSHDRTPIDHFFTSLAESQEDRAAGIILSGVGSDGAIGIKRIKKHGGLTVAQDPNQAEYDGMAQSAIATGMVDLVLPLERISEQLITYALTEPQVQIPPDDQRLDDAQEQLLQKIFARIHAQTGRDFRRYKRSTLMRRIARRMQIHHVERMPQYLDILGRDPRETRALSDEFLINVTEFFRDEDVFRALEEQVLPEILSRKDRMGQLRAWSVGCATGEEAYSLAILLLEATARRGTAPHMQIFASDLHEPSLQHARDGHFPETIESSVSHERLQRYFQRDNGGYRVRREVRDLVLFATHNVLSDPPFSKIDLIVCRNLLIYLPRDVQGDIIRLFHYALSPDGVLVLGPTESIERTDLFQHRDKTHCIYQRRNVAAADPHVSVFPLHAPKERAANQTPVRRKEDLSFDHLHARLLERAAPPSLLIDSADDVVHLSLDVGRFLMQPGGRITCNVFRLVREEFRVELRFVVQMARRLKRSTTSKRIAFACGEQAAKHIVVTAHPAEDSEHAGMLLVTFAELPADEPAAPAAPGPGHPSERELQAEVELSRQRLQTIIEEYETSQEEMRVANEGMRSALEELESSREELQSMNEELTTVSQESRHKVEELRQLSADLQNLLTATDIATLFLDRGLRILRFTPAVNRLFNVRAADRGRPLSDLTHRLGYARFSDDARKVLETLVPAEREVTSDEGRWYLSRILPYRSTDNRIDGIVLTFVDITELKHTEAALRESEAKYRRLITQVEDYAIFSVDVEGRVTSWNHGCQRVLGYDNEEFVGLDTGVLFTPEDRDAGVPQRELQQAADIGRSDNTRWMLAKGGKRFYASGVTTALRNAAGQLVGFSKMMRDQTDWRLAQDALEKELSRSRLLQQVSTRLIQKGDVTALLDEILEAAIAISGADMGVIQMREPATGDLLIVTQRGFTQPFLDAFGRIRIDRATPFGTAVQEGRRIVIPDARQSTVFSSHRSRQLVLAAGIGALHSTPLISRSGRMLGMIWTHWRRPSQPGEGELGQLDLLARQAADLVERNEAEAALRASEREQRELSRSLEERVIERTAKLADQTRHLRRLATELTSAEQRERKRLAALLHDELQQLLTSARMQLNQALGQMHGNTGLLEEALAKAEQRLGEALDAARDLTRQLRPPALYESGLVSALEWLVKEMEARHGLAVTLRAAQLPRRLSEDIGALLFEFAREFLFNVVKHSEASAAVAELGHDEKDLRLVVKDEGTGFSIEAADEDLLKRGIGLFSIRERVSALGGAMTVESAPGKGTLIEVTIPVEVAFTEQAPAHTVEPLRVTPPQRSERAAVTTDHRIRVLLVDDHALVRQGIANLLRSDPRIVVVGEAADGVEALQAVEREHPQVVLLDINMPRMNGIEATREIARRWPHLGIIGLSVQDDDITAKSMLQAGATAFVPKAGDADKMIDTIVRLAACAPAHPENQSESQHES